ELDLEFAPGGAAHVRHDVHDLHDDGRDRIDVARQGQVHLHEEVAAVELAALRDPGLHLAAPCVFAATHAGWIPARRAWNLGSGRTASNIGPQRAHAQKKAFRSLRARPSSASVASVSPSGERTKAAWRGGKYSRSDRLSSSARSLRAS